MQQCVLLHPHPCVRARVNTSLARTQHLTLVTGQSQQQQDFDNPEAFMMAMDNAIDKASAAGGASATIPEGSEPYVSPPFPLPRFNPCLYPPL